MYLYVHVTPQIGPMCTVDLIQIDKFLDFNFGILKFQSSKIKVSILEY